VPALAALVAADLYDWNVIPLGQLLWLKEPESYRQYPRCRIRKPTIWIR
jgi:arylsulfatase